MTKRCENELIIMVKEIVADLMESIKLKKKQKLRNNEYYNLQNIFDKLYEDSKNNKKFKNLYDIITCESNIMLAFRNIKKNKGSGTVGTDNININKYKDMNKEEFCNYVQEKFKDYKPKSVRRVEIPKDNGKKRPLGIPCMDDRIIQQCIKQVLEPICEAKFHNHSYGFRPNRATKDAIARCQYLINQVGLHYVVDLDIKSFFDNVNHGKLIKQMWSMGIIDKRIISIIGKILKSEIKDIGIPKKGTPQGGIISPLLANICMNEFDWWLSNQWETFKTEYKYCNLSNRYRSLKKSNLKEFYFVRYADDFKIFCKDYETARKLFIGSKMWLKDRLGLEISEEKSKITNIRKNYTEFLGFKLKGIINKNKIVCISKMNDKAKKKVIKNIKNQVKKIQKKTNIREVSKLNGIILGMHNYYKIATRASEDFAEIHFLVHKCIYNRLRKKFSRKPNLSKGYIRLYGKYNKSFITICGLTLYPIYGCNYKKTMCFDQNINNYTKEGRKLIHDKIDNMYYFIRYLLMHSNENDSAELTDNKISLICGQRGKCYVTGKELEVDTMECHHKKPKSLGGSDEYKNLVWLSYEVHKLVHCKVEKTIKKYLEVVELDEKGLKKLNSLRKQVGNSEIIL